MKRLFILIIISTFITTPGISTGLFATSNNRVCSISYWDKSKLLEKNITKYCANSLIWVNEINSGWLIDVQRDIEEINNSITEWVGVNIPLIIQIDPLLYSEKYIVHNIPMMTEFVWTWTIMDYIIPKPYD